MVRRIFSGGDQSFMSAVSKADRLEAVDCRFWKPQSQIVRFSVQLAETCAAINAAESIDQDLMTQLETIFKSLSSLNASFQQPNIGNQCCTSKHTNLDLVAVQSAFGHVARIEHDALKQIIWEGITELLPTLSDDPNDVESLRVYMLLPFYHEFTNSKRYAELHTKFARSVLRLKTAPAKVLENWWKMLPIEHFERLVDHFRGVVQYIITFVQRPAGEQKTFLVQYEPNLVLALRMMLLLFRLNRKLRHGAEQMACVRFHFPGLEEVANMQQDYLLWLMDRSPHKFYLCDYPFLFDAKTKTLLLQTDQSVQMNSAMHQNITEAHIFMGMPIEPFITIRVRRTHIVEDTLREIQQFQLGDLKKPLRVMFDGEEAEDAGGVRKEFFLLLLKDLLDPKYGMFVEYEETRAIWFAEMTFEDNIMYMLIGALCGLAIYNFTIIYLPFPLVLYKKLLGEGPDLDDLRDISPTMAKSLQSLLDYEGDDFEEVFGLTFELTRSVFGQAQVVPLKPNGENTAVTQHNKYGVLGFFVLHFHIELTRVHSFREEYVELYVQYMLETSVERQFNGFKDGFMRVCGGKVMALFEPHELMAVVIGNEDYDWHILEEHSKYKNGYTSGHKTVRIAICCTCDWWAFLNVFFFSDTLILGGVSRISA